MAELPKHQKCIQILENRANKTLSKAEKDSTTPSIWHDVSIKETPLEIPKSDSSDDRILVVKIKSFAFNHRDIWIRKGLYPNIRFGATLGSDCVGSVVYPADHELFGKDVLVYPAINWIHDPRGPDVPGKPYGIFGGTYETDGVGTFSEFINVRASHCVPSPGHLTALNASAVPLAGLTAFRAVFHKGQVKASSNVLITGIGGGVAIWALQFCVAVGANVWVTSSSEEKIKKACELGAKGGVNYREADWNKKLAALLPTDNPLLDTVIDSGGGDIVQKCNPILRPGGIVVNFGSTSGRSLTFTMSDVMKNLELRGCTMGSLKEFKEMVELVNKHKIHPVVYKTLSGFEKVEEGFQIMKGGQQFGKITVLLSSESQHCL